MTRHSFFREAPALTEFGLDAVAAFEGCVQAGDGVAHALKMRRRSAEREQIRVVTHRSTRHLSVVSRCHAFRALKVYL